MVELQRGRVCPAACAAGLFLPSCLLGELEGTAHYSGLLLTPAKGFGQGFFAVQATTKKAVYTFYAYFRYFFVFRSNLSKGSNCEKKAASFWTLSKSGLHPPPPHPCFGYLWGNFCLSRLRKKNTTKNYLETTLQIP